MRKIKNSREHDMERVEAYIVKEHNGVRSQLSETEEKRITQNVMMQFYELFLNEDEIPYIMCGNKRDVDILKLMAIIESYPITALNFKVVNYKILLESNNYVEVQLEFITGYITLSIASELKSDIDILERINRELVLRRGINQDDIDTQNMFYHHYQLAKKELSYIDIST